MWVGFFMDFALTAVPWMLFSFTWLAALPKNHQINSSIFIIFRNLNELIVFALEVGTVTTYQLLFKSTTMLLWGALFLGHPNDDIFLLLLFLFLYCEKVKTNRNKRKKKNTFQDHQVWLWNRQLKLGWRRKKDLFNVNMR